MSPRLRFLFACSPSLLAAAWVAACATDNGDSVHGPQYGPVPERPEGGSDDGGPITMGEGGPQPMNEGGTTDAKPDAPIVACTAGTIAVLAGGDTTLTGSVQIKGGAWSGAAITGGAAKSAPALVAFGTGFLGLTRGPSDALQSVTAASTTFGAVSAVGTNTTLGAPALAVMGTKAEAAILSGAPDPNKFYHLENSGTSWGAQDPILSMAVQSFGPTPAALAAAGTDLVFAQDGDNEGLYYQTLTTTTWSDATAIAGAGTAGKLNATAWPALVTVDGSFDLVLLYGDNTANHVIGYATRTSATKAWGSGQVTQGTAQSAEQIAVARISPTLLMVTFRGNNSRPYFMTGTLGVGTITWSVPAPLLADASTVDSPPAVAKGVCGDDAVAVFASGGQVKATRYRGNSWSAPESVAGASGSRVSVATR